MQRQMGDMMKRMGKLGPRGMNPQMFSGLGGGGTPPGLPPGFGRK